VRVGLNALDLAPGRAGGIETYFRNLLAALQALPPGDDCYDVLCLRPVAAELAVTSPTFRVRAYACGRPSAGWLARRSLQRLTGLDLLAPLVNRLGLDVVHHPFTTINTPGLRAPAVLSFMDMQHEFFPEYFAPAELRQRRRSYRASVAAATRIIAISQHVKGTLVEVYGADPGKIDVVYFGSGSEFGPVDDVARVAAARRRHGLARPFLFYPAASWPHKNHLALLTALRLLRDRRRFDGELVLTGVAREAHGEVSAAIDRLGLSGAVRILGYLPTSELPAIYAAAEMLVFPSLFEGFGLPLLEAMACGCPVVSSSATSLPEVAGDAALFFDPRSPEDMAARIGEVLEAPDLRRRLRTAGLARAAEFRWERTARETLAVYRRAAGAG
jgi:glycosyltransferase involved in cell wall biosynthesis